MTSRRDVKASLGELELIDNDRFVLFPNKFKERDNQPDFTGKLWIADFEVQIVAWKRRSKNNAPYLSGQINPKYVKPEENTSTVHDNPFDLDDEIPF